MVRGFIYSLCAVCFFLLGSIGWMILQAPSEETMTVLGGWLFLLCFFAVGPLFFAIGYWHSRQLNPQESHWDPELGE